MPASVPQRVQVRLPVPNLWRALRRLRSPRGRRTRTLTWLRIGALALAVGLQLLFVLELMKPTPPLPPTQHEEELELVLDDILAAATDDGGPAIPMPRLSGGRRAIAQSPLGRPRLAQSAAAPATPQLAAAPPTRVMQTAARAVPLSAPQPTAAPAERPQPAQLALPQSQPPEIARPRVLQVDPTPVREWAPDPVVVQQPPRPQPPQSEPPPVLPRAVLAPDRPTLTAQPPAAIEPQRIEPVTPELATAAPLPRVALEPTEAVPRAEPLPTPLQTAPTPPRIQLEPTRRALQVDDPVAVQQQPEPVEPLARPVAPVIALVEGPRAPPVPRIERTPVSRAPLAPPEPVEASAITPPAPAVLAVPNRDLLRAERTVQVLQADHPADAAVQPEPAAARDAPAIQIAAPNMPDRSSLRAVTPEAPDSRTLAATAMPNAPGRQRPAVDAARTAIGIAEVSSPQAAEAGPADRASGVPSEFDGPGAAPGPAANAADLLSGISTVARDQVTAATPGPPGRRGTFLDRRYDPFYDDLPNRLNLMEQSEPGGLRQVLSFLAKSLQGGGVTLRGGKLEAGAEALNRPLPQEEDVEAALGMLLDRWLELHGGDAGRACLESQAEMTDVVRTLLCAPESAARPVP